ncbi:MAG TPA: N-acetylmuramoyl-L-alanine amidase [Flavisolibacter sp.]
MLKKTLFLFPLLFVALTILSFTTEKRKAVKTIIIDPGHGGADQGAAGTFTTEAQLTLAMSKKLGELVRKELPDVNVLFTRTADIFPGNSPTKRDGDRYRADFANKSGADLFISIHCNSSGRTPGGWYEKRIVGYDEKETFTGKGKKKKKKMVKVPIHESFFVPNAAKGTETFIWTAKENSHKGQMVSERHQHGEFGDDDSAMLENDPVINALKLVYTKKYFFKSLKLAELVQQEFTKAGRTNRGVKQRNEKGIWVLHATGMPSILIEAGFITNKEEEEYMNSEAGQEEVAQNILSAIRLYINEVDSPKKGPENETIGTPGSVAALLNTSRKKNLLS